MKTYYFLKIFFSLIVVVSFILLVANIDLNYKINSEKFIVDFSSNNIYQDVSTETISEIIQSFVHLQDSSYYDINISLLEDLIMQEKYVKKAEVYLDLEGVLNASIDLREPFMRGITNNRVYYYDAEGYILPPLNIVDDDLLVVSGNLFLQDTTQLLNLVTDLYNDNLLSELIGGVHYDNYYGYILSLRFCDLGINLGHTPIIEMDKIYDLLKSNGNTFGC